MKKILALLLCACMLVPMLIACNGGSDVADTSVDTTTAEEIEDNVSSDLVLVADGKTDYIIVRPDKAQTYIIDSMGKLRDAVKAKYNVNISPQDDWVKDLGKDESYVSEANEILIGATNRKESREVLAALNPGEYTVCVKGNKLVILGYTDYLTSIAVEAFISSVVDSADSAKLAVKNDFSVLKSQVDFYTLLTGVTMYAMGDSYFGGSSIGKENTWVNLLGKKYGMHFVNYGIGGSTMSNYVTTNNPMVDRYTSMEKGDADIILLEGGRNDRTKEVPIGDVESRDSKTFMGAINIMLDSMLETYPNALIFLITPWYATGKVAATGLSNVDYANAMRTLAEHRNDPRIVCLYAADPNATGVNMNDANFRAQYCTKPDDVSHLNVEGMKMILPYMEQFIATELAKFKGLTLDS